MLRQLLRLLEKSHLANWHGSEVNSLVATFLQHYMERKKGTTAAIAFPKFKLYFLRGKKLCQPQAEIFTHASIKAALTLGSDAVM